MITNRLLEMIFKILDLSLTFKHKKKNNFALHQSTIGI